MPPDSSFLFLLLGLACGASSAPAGGAGEPAAERPKKGSDKKDVVFPPSFQPTQQGSGSMAGVRMAWRDLLGTGCDLERVHIWIPVEARVLRNVPYAIAGHRFESDELMALFEADGGWYHPTKGPPAEGAAKLREDELACVGRLKALEIKLREDERPEMSPAAEARFTRDPGAFAAWWQWCTMADLYPFSQEISIRNDEGGWTWTARVAGCQSEDCGTYVIICPAEGLCRWGAAG